MRQTPVIPAPADHTRLKSLARSGYFDEAGLFTLGNTTSRKLSGTHRPPKKNYYSDYRIDTRRIPFGLHYRRNVQVAQSVQHSTIVNAAFVKETSRFTNSSIHGLVFVQSHDSLRFAQEMQRNLHSIFSLTERIHLLYFNVGKSSVTRILRKCSSLPKCKQQKINILHLPPKLSIHLNAIC